MRHFKTIDWSVSLSLLFACVLTVIAACVDSSGPLGGPNVVVTDVRTVSAVQVTLAQSTLAPGQTTQASVVATSADGKVVGVGHIDFSSQNPTIATVSSKGLVTAVAGGVAVIQAAVATRAGTASLTVQPLASPVAAVAAVAVAFDSTKISVGHVAQASAVVKDTAGNAITGQTITWSSLTPNVASVSSSGAVMAIAAGVASIKATASSVSGNASITVEPPPVATVPVATVIVVIDSTTLSMGHTAQATATAKDSAGNPINGQTVIWTSLSPSIASISSSGKITALAVGVVLIQATISGCSGNSPLEIRSASSALLPPDLAFSDFNDGTWGPYYASIPADEDVVSDPTGSGRGMVSRFHYIGTNQDRNRNLEYVHPTHLGETIYSRGEFYLPPGIDLSDANAIQRKLLYWQRHVDYNKYGGNGGPVFWSIVKATGSGLQWNGGYVPQTAPLVEIQTNIATGLVSGRWYTLEQQTTMNSTPSAQDGVVRIWLDGTLIFEKTDMRWTDPAWDGQVFGNSVLSWSDVYFERYDIGDQVNWSGTYDEYRYWDNVAFSTTRIGQ